MTSITLTGFNPIVTKTTQILILGSFPSVASLDQQQYYAHPRNQFWRILGELLNTPFATLPYVKRIESVLTHHIGIWDVIDQTERKGSLDSDIKNPVANNLLSLLNILPHLHTIAFNGQTATKIGLKQLGQAVNTYRVLSLPSTSPAYTLAYEQKLTLWRQLMTTEEK